MSIATNCIEDLEVKLRSTKEFGGKIFHVYSEDDLLDQSKLMSLPAVGVMYQGIIVEPGQDRSRQGLLGTLRVSLILVIDSNTVGLDRKDEAAELMDTIRCAILTTTSPTGHKWQFQSEIPLGKMGNTLLYQQRWGTAAPLTS
jgi:hypothetical protein